MLNLTDDSGPIPTKFGPVVQDMIN